MKENPKHEMGCLEKLLIAGAITAGLLSGALGRCSTYNAPKVLIEAPIYENYENNTYQP